VLQVRPEPLFNGIGMFTVLYGNRPFDYHLFDLGLILQAMFHIGGYQTVDRSHEGHSDPSIDF
jgi:hypothetical protein